MSTDGRKTREIEPTGTWRPAEAERGEWLEPLQAYFTPPWIVGLVGGFFASLIFLAIMRAVPGTLFMKLVEGFIPPGVTPGGMQAPNEAGWVLHAAVNGVWMAALGGWIRGRAAERREIPYAFVWALVLAALVILANPLVGLPVTLQLILIEGGAYAVFGLAVGVMFWLTRRDLGRQPAPSEA